MTRSRVEAIGTAPRGLSLGRRPSNRSGRGGRAERAQARPYAACRGSAAFSRRHCLREQQGRSSPNPIDQPHVGYASTSPEVSLPGDLAEVNGMLFEAMLAEGVTCSRQGDTLRFLLEQLRESMRRAF